jgi:hypothetical protein
MLIPAAFDWKLRPIRGGAFRYAGDPAQSFSWKPTILPYHDQQSLFDRIDFGQPALSERNLPAARTRLDIHLCPSGPSGPRVLEDAHAGGDSLGKMVWSGVNAALSDYRAVAWVTGGTDDFHPTIPGCWGSAVVEDLREQHLPMLRDTTDGLSNTLLLVEQGGFPDRYDVEKVEPGWWKYGGWISVDPTFLSGNRGINRTNFLGIFSFHSGGAYVALADGSSHFLGEGIDPAVLYALMTREGGEPIRDKDWR